MHYKPKHAKNGRPHYPVLVFRIAALLVCLTLITTYLLSGAYSKFYTSSSGGDSARVAHFSPDFTTSTVITVENQLPGFPDIPNHSYLIDFSVQNYTGDKASEVAMKYKIVLKTTGNIPLKFTLLNGEGNQLETWDCNGTSGECVYGYDPLRVFGVGTKETVQYKLKIEWPSDRNNAQFSGMTDAVYLSAEFEQID